VIDLNEVQALVDDAQELIRALHGQDLDESRAIEDQSKGKRRRERARTSADIRRLADTFHHAGSLTTQEYWKARA
jgi:hypothetical protein